MPDKTDSVTTQHDTVDTCRPAKEVVFTLQMVDRSTEGPRRGQQEDEGTHERTGEQKDREEDRKDRRDP